MATKKMKMKISRKLRKSRKNKKTSKAFKKGGGMWESIKNAFSNTNSVDANSDDTITSQEQPSTNNETTNEMTLQTNNGGCTQRKRIKKNKRA